MYVELTPEDTLRDLQTLLIDSLPGFEFPRFSLDDYTIDTTVKQRSELTDDDFVISDIVWYDLEENDIENNFNSSDDNLLVDNSCFNFTLTSEEINIIAILMVINWVQRQVTSIENTRMKYSGSDFKMTSQANHLQKLLTLLTDCQKQSNHMQRLYKRRRLIQNENSPFNGFYRSNWDTLGRGVYYDRYDD